MLLRLLRLGIFLLVVMHMVRVFILVISLEIIFFLNQSVVLAIKNIWGGEVTAVNCSFPENCLYFVQQSKAYIIQFKMTLHREKQPLLASLLDKDNNSGRCILSV